MQSKGGSVSTLLARPRAGASKVFARVFRDWAGVPSGPEQPSDLWCPVGGGCFKPLPDKPIEVLVVESSQGPLWLGMEFLPEDEELAQAAFDALAGGLRIG